MISNKLSETEKIEIIRNAISSFEHGIEHLIDGINEKNVKFSILHIFNALELIIKAHLGDINEALLWPNVDKKNDKSADISILIKRMDQFSAKKFDKKLESNIEKLREKRNEIEHKKIVIEDEKEMMILLFCIIEEIVIFAQKAFSYDGIGIELVKKWRDDYVDSYMKIKIMFDDDFKKIVEKITEIRKKEKIGVMICAKCFLKTIPFKDERGVVKCLNCGNELYGIECDTCGNVFFIDKDDDFHLMIQRCGGCDTMPPEVEEEMAEVHYAQEEQQDREMKEFKDSIPYQKFE